MCACVCVEGHSRTGGAILPLADSTRDAVLVVVDKNKTVFGAAPKMAVSLNDPKKMSRVSANNTREQDHYPRGEGEDDKEVRRRRTLSSLSCGMKFHTRKSIGRVLVAATITIQRCRCPSHGGSQATRRQWTDRGDRARRECRMGTASTDIGTTSVYPQEVREWLDPRHGNLLHRVETSDRYGIKVASKLLQASPAATP